MKTSTETLAKAMSVLAKEIQSPDGVANTAVAEASERLLELAAQVNRLHSSLRLLAHTVAKSGVDLGDGLYLAAEALDATPEHCLAAHDAEVAKAGFMHCIKFVRLGIEPNSDHAEQYAAQIRAKAQK